MHREFPELFLARIKIALLYTVASNIRQVFMVNGIPPLLLVEFI